MPLRVEPLNAPLEKRSSLWAMLAGAALPMLAIGYPVALLIFMTSLRFVGEKWWATTIALYLPRAPFFLPLLPLSVAIVWCGPRKLLWTQLLAVALFLELMGFRLAWPTPATPGALHLRIVSCNINGGGLGLGRILRPLLARNPDIIVLQEVKPTDSGLLAQQVPGYQVRGYGQFWVASRFPIDAMAAQTEFAQYRIRTPAGPIMFFNVHPVSPRDGLESVRGDGLHHQLLRGDLFNTRARAVVDQNTAIRLSQLASIATTASRYSAEPVIIAGDTNLPDLSWAYARWLGQYQDAFSAAGSGLGYSFPSPRDPWMRIDRILADKQHFRFRSFEVINQYLSDHFAITSELELVR